MKRDFKTNTGCPKNFFPYIIHLRQIIFIFVGNDLHRNKQYYLAKTDKYYFAEFVETYFFYPNNTILAVLEQNVQIQGRGKVPPESIFLGRKFSLLWTNCANYHWTVYQSVLKFPFLPNFTLCKSSDLIVILKSISVSLFSDILPYGEAEIRKLRTIYLPISQALST